MSRSELVAIRSVVHQLVETFGAADYYQQQVDQGGHCAELWNALGTNGYLGVHLPAEYGGGGLGLAELSAVVEETAFAGCPLLALLFSAGVTGTILDRSASAAQRERWLPGIAAGRTRLSFAITEPDAGSNAHRIATTAVRAGDRYILNGQKVFITGMESADWVMVVAATAGAGSGRLSVFMIEGSSPGLTWTPIRTVMNQPDRSHQVFFDDVEVPADQLVGVEGAGLKIAFTGLNTERILTSSICTGVGRYALRRAVDYAKQRKVWDQPIGAHQAVAHPLAAAHMHVEAARTITDRACAGYDAGREVGELANMAKYLGAAAGLAALDAAVNTLGGNGVTYEYRLAPYYWLVRMLNMGPVSKEMILNFVAERSLGLPRSY
ncbi:acyl-CoA/acyl-ACP dehydrogenase [Mycobacterium sp. CVI_P3]|uniref:Acyl-CoA/acyl-ACP dehydrogenase n=1 Tax=Mycobacterium pinniadriaticum TaxID=2994102 RepID=A0ABT3S9Y4_9MYCO|nr:acyl-CoA dehydrogenase family protein [Mycobacterium pinniadriaticum]MCX2930052.1 acyl-CoA/acyl-ACP dehydrogenase [Mycobacterium pinniadriaticum]MCX2936299.1 acyl-CoA/acyl-ACP dehydrogenase [Mycobacterium pinniadriaticum]